MNTWTVPSILLPLLFFYFNLSFSLQLSSLSLLFLFHTQDITSSKLPNARSAKFQPSSVDIPASNFLKGQKWCAMLANIFVISVNSIYIYTKSRVSIRLDPFSSLFFSFLQSTSGVKTRQPHTYAAGGSKIDPTCSLLMKQDVLNVLHRVRIEVDGWIIAASLPIRSRTVIKCDEIIAEKL